MNIKKIALFTLATFMFSNAFSASLSNWQPVTIRDLNTIRTILKTDDVRFANPTPSTLNWYKKGYQISLKMAKAQPNKAGHFYTLEYYTQGFRDPHLHIEHDFPTAHATDIPDIPYHFAGMILRYQKGKYFVMYRQKNRPQLPPVNAELLQCNNRKVQLIIKHEIIPFHFTAGIPSSYNFAANLLFLDGNPFRNYFKSCTFKWKSTIKSYPIHWQTVDVKEMMRLRKIFVLKLPYRIQPFSKNGIWISMPSYDKDNKSSKYFFKMLANAAPLLRHYNPIVLDVRSNGGGDYSLVRNALQGIYGRRYFQAQQPANVWSQWRLSKLNLKQIAMYLPEKYKTMARAYKNGRKLYPQNQPPILNKSTHPNVQQRYLGNLYYLTSKSCMSACLLAADAILRLPNTAIIGQETYGDTMYGNINIAKLPSGAELQYTMTVWHNRKRPVNFSYQPKYLYPGNIGDTKRLMMWVTNGFN